MRLPPYVSNAILWAAAIVASAIAGAPVVVTAFLLPVLAATALLITWPPRTPKSPKATA